jgi:hypothetical protein
MAAAAAAVRNAKKRAKEQDEGPKQQNHGVYVLPVIWRVDNE